MSSLLIQQDAGEWHVWLGLDGEHPIRDPFGFIVGQGATRDEAVAAAARDLERCVEQLQAEPGAVPEEVTA